MTMTDWSNHLDGILTSTGEKLLKGNGTVSHLQAMKKAEDEYKKYKARTISDVENDYLNSIEMIESKCKKNDRYITRSNVFYSTLLLVL